MSTPADRATGAAGWATARERSGPRMLALMRWIALTAGRRVSRWVLHPISLYFVLFGGEASRQSRRYLTRVFERPAGFADVYRHIHTFAATLLDRVYFLQDRLGEFRIAHTDVHWIDERIARGEGQFMIGAHFGSFEALRALGVDQGRRVAMVMYEDNARQINETLAAIAPNARPHTIALGRLGAMLQLRNWLDDGGVAGMLADRTLPGPAMRSRTLVLPFLGAPARFSDGPFRLAAMLRRPVVFIAGIYRGGDRYELRFEQLADFGAEHDDTDALIRATVERYVALLEALCRDAPYNWFNFFDFWADADADAS
jgi:predicted LPLAT superfamily acyltransferase